MKATLQLLGTDFLARAPGSAMPEVRLDGDDGKNRLKAWAARYDRATRKGDPDTLMLIGREMFDWLDASGWASAWAAAAGARQLDIQVDTPSAEQSRCLLDAPWELLAQADGHLADDRVQRT